MQDNTNMQNPDIIHQESTNDPLPSRPDNNYNTARTDNNVIPLPNETFSIPQPVVDVTSPSKMASPTATTSASTPKPTPTKPKPSDTPIIGDRIKVYWPKYKKYYEGTVISDKGKGGKQEVRYDDEVNSEPILEKLSGPRHAKWIPLADDNKAITKFNLDDNETLDLG